MAVLVVLLAAFYIVMQSSGKATTLTGTEKATILPPNRHQNLTRTSPLLLTPMMVDADSSVALAVQQ